MAKKRIVIEQEKPEKPDTSCLGQAIAIGGILVSGLFLSNMALGLAFEIPDNLPFVGNLDEAAATAMLLACLRYLGFDFLPFKRGPKAAGELKEMEEDSEQSD